MGLLNKLKEALSGNSSDTAKDVSSDAVETVTDTVKNATDETIKITEIVEKKDNCCGGNCGS